MSNNNNRDELIGNIIGAGVDILVNSAARNTVNRSNVTFRNQSETREMAERREKYELVHLEKSTKIFKGATIIGALVTAATFAASASLGVAAFPLSAAITAGAALGWASNSMHLDSKIKAATDQPIEEMAQNMRRR